MKVTPNILLHEFLGLDVLVVKSSQPSYLGISGRVVDETRNTFLILDNHGMKKTLVKKSTVYQFSLPDKTVVEIDGNALVGRPEERIKKKIRRLW